MLRVRPVVYEAPRLLDVPLRLGDHEIPAGWFARPYLPLVRRDPEGVPSPEEFLEMRVMIREVLHRLELSAPDQAPEARRPKNVSFAPAKLTRVIARARTPARTP